MKLAAVEGSGADEAAHSQTGFWPQQENHRSNSGSLSGAELKPQNTRKATNSGNLRFLQKIRARLPQVEGLSCVYSMCLLFILCVPPKKED